MADNPKLSAALLKFAKPLLDLLPPDPDPAEVKSLVQIAVLVWNAVVVEKRDRPSPYLKQAHEAVRAKFTGRKLTALTQILSDLEASKRNEAQPDMRVVALLEVFRDSQGFTVRAGEGRLRDEGPPDTPDHDAAWKAFYLAAMTFRALEPWNWMGDAERIGVMDPESGEVGWVVVMGGGGEFRGLALYLGDEGFHQVERMIADDEPEDSAMYGQDALVLGFVDRDFITPEEHRRIKRLGLKFRGRGEWPQLDSHGRGRLPLPPTDPEVARMEAALRQVVDVAARATEDPDLVLPDLNGRRLVRVPTRASGPMTWREERRAVPKAGSEPIPEFDQVWAERLRSEFPRSRLQIECDLFPGSGVIKEPGRPLFAPAIFLAVDAEGGAVIRVEMHEPSGREPWAQEQLLHAVESLGAIPERLFLVRRSLQRVIEPVAWALGIQVERVDGLPHVADARGSLEVFLRR